MRRKLAAGNWKMNGTQSHLDMLKSLASAHPDPSSDILICPPATLLIPAVVACAGTSVSIGGQNCHAAPKGAHTGDVSADMLRDAGATAVILGHSERREAYGESDADIAVRTGIAQATELTAIVCLGESEAQREKGEALDVISAQLKGSVPADVDTSLLVIAYEPIWAIGTGKVPTVEQISEVHHLMRQQLVDRFGDDGTRVRLLYGGSVKAANAAEIFAVPDVDGALVGGASLKTEDFSPIIEALDAS